MYSAGEDTSFGEVNEREICKKMENLLMTSLDIVENLNLIEFFPIFFKPIFI